MISFQQLIEKTLTPAEKKKREEIAKAMEKDNPDMPMDKKMAIATATAKRVAESDFEPHMMYDPKTGKGYKANKPEDHVRMKKIGYTHEKPELKENYRTLARKGMGTETKGQVKVGQEMDFYETERGDKLFGKVIKVSPTGYIVQAMERGNNKKYSFRYHDRAKAKKLLSMNEDGQYVSPSQMTDKQKADLKAKQQAERERRMRQMKMGQKDSEEERARKQRERERRLKQYAGKKESVNEDGHNDVESMKNKVKTAMSALQKMNTELGKLGDQESLPTWWTNKVAVAVDKLDGMADYIDTQVESVNEAVNYHTKISNINIANAMKNNRMLKKYVNLVPGSGTSDTYEIANLLSKKMKKFGFDKKEVKAIEDVMQTAFATNESFKPTMIKDYPRIVDFYIQFRGGKGDRITSPDNKKDYEKALKLTQAFMRKNKITSKLETGTPEQGSSAYKIGLVLDKKKPEWRVDLRPLVDQIAKLKTAEDHGGGYDKPLKEGKSFSNIMEVSQQAQIRKAIDIASSMGGNMTGAVKRIEAIKKGLSKNKNVAKALRLANEEVISEVTDKEINAMKQLSKDAEKIKKNYQKIVNMGDKELKDKKYNKEYEDILQMSQSVLSLIGKLSNQKMINKESLEEKLSKADLKMIDMMYDKKGKLTDVGKAVMNYKPGDNIQKIVQNLNKKEAVSPAQQAAIAISKKEKGEKPLKESINLDEDVSSFLLTGLTAFMGVNAVAFIGLIASEMAGIDIIGKTEKAIENIKSKFKRNKNYKPSKSELETLKKVGQEIKKKDPSAYKKAQQKANSMKESRARRDAMRGMSSDPDFQPKGFKDIRATDADRKAASKNVLMQIRKATDLPKGGEIEFPSGKKGKISQADAKKVDKMFNVLKKPQDKEKFQKVISKDLNSIKNLLKRLGR
jgi:hypothetical protein